MSKPTKKQIQQEIDRLKVTINSLKGSVALKENMVTDLEAQLKKAKE